MRILSLLLIFVLSVGLAWGMRPQDDNTAPLRFIYAEPSLSSDIIGEIPNYIKICIPTYQIDSNFVWANIKAEWNFLIFQDKLEGWIPIKRIK